MSIQLSVAIQNERLNRIEDYINSLVGIIKLRIYTGTPPANVDTAESGTLLLEMVLPTDWMAAASSGSKSKLGTWSGNASTAGTAGYFRILTDNAGTITAHLQGTITDTAGTGDLKLDSTALSATQAVTIVDFTLFDNNA